MTVNEVKGAWFRKKENVLSSHSINLYLPVFGLKTDFLIAKISYFPTRSLKIALEVTGMQLNYLNIKYMTNQPVGCCIILIS